MANVRYSGGGTSATLGTKTIDENGIYNASSDDLDGYSQVTVEVPQPSGDLAMTLTENAVYDGVDVKDYASATITVDVPVPPAPQTQAKSVTATVSQQIVRPDNNYTLSQVTVNPQHHAQTYSPAEDTEANDMGLVHNYRYVDTRGMINPAGTKSVSYTTNGVHTEDVNEYANISIDIDVPVSGDLGTKSIIANGTYTALDDNLDGYSEVEVNVPQNATLGIKSITVNGEYNAITDGYDGYSRVSVSVPGAALQSSKTVTATTSQQTVVPDYGYDALEQVIVDPQVHTQTYTPAENTAANDMGAQNNYRYVNTSGMVTPSSITPSNSSPAALTANTPVTPTTAGYAVRSYDSITPSDSSPARMYEDSIYKTNSSGYAVSNVNNVTPSDYSPPYLLQNNIYKPQAYGYLYSSQQIAPTSITPSNSTPVALTANTPVNPTASGYAISSYSSKTPSDLTPASVSSGAIFKAMSNGYLYKTVQPKAITGTVTLSSSSTTKITCGFEPRYIALMVYKDITHYSEHIYNSDANENYTFRGAMNGGSNGAGYFNFPTTSTSTSGVIMSTDSTGFTVAPASTTGHGTTAYYFAIG